MRDPDSSLKYELETPPAIITIHDIPEYNLYDYDLNDDKSFQKYLSAVEKCVRGSFEYRTLVQYLRNYMDMNQCAFYKNVNNLDTTKIRIEIHHEPLSLYDICVIVYNKRVAFNEPLDEEMVAKEVTYLHYDLMVGLIPLAETVHQLVHAQYLFVPNSAVFGKYQEFINRYEPYMLPEQLETLEKIKEASLAYDFSDAETILSRQYIYVDMSGEYSMPTYEQISELLKERIKEITESNSTSSI